MGKDIFNRNFLLAFLAMFTFTSVFHVLLPTLPLYLKGLGAKEDEIGILIGVFFVSSLVLRPFIGKALTRIPEKNFMMAGALFFAFTSVSYLFVSHFWPILIVRLIQGVGFSFFHTASFTMIVNISSKEHRGQSLSYFYLAINIAGAIGPSFGMFLINRFSFRVLFLICVILSLCSLMISWRLRKREITQADDLSLDDGFFLNCKAIPSSIIGFLSLFIWGGLTTFFPIYATHHGVSNPGIFFTVIALMLILGRALGGKLLDLYSKERIILPCIVASIISMMILSFSKTILMFILVGIIFGVGHAFLMPSMVLYTLERVGSSPGPIMGTFTAITDLGICLGPTLMGIILRLTSYKNMFLCLALVGLINLVYFLLLMRKRN